MPELNSPTLGTSKEKSPVAWAIHQNGVYLLGELFGANYYRGCLTMAKAMASNHRPILTAIAKDRNMSTDDLERTIAHLEDVSHWAGKIESENYHTINTHAFITLWAAQEAGLENIISEIIRTSFDAAEIASGKFSNGKYSIATWPWSESMCLEITQKLDAKAKNFTANGEEIAQRIKTLFSWFNLDINIDDKISKKYNEASMVRNTILHRYGYLNSRNAQNFPELSPWIEKVIPITSDRLTSYYNAIAGLHLAIAKEVWSSQYK